MTCKALDLDPTFEDAAAAAAALFDEILSNGPTEVGVRTHAGIPWRFADTPNGVRSPAPCIGEHTDEVMRDLLGLVPDEIARLRADEILY